LRDPQLSGALAADEHIRQTGEILGTSGAYQLRYQMLVTAPAASRRDRRVRILMRDIGFRS